MKALRVNMCKHEWVSLKLIVLSINDNESGLYEGLWNWQCCWRTDVWWNLEIILYVFSKLDVDRQLGMYTVIEVPKVSCFVQNISTLGRFCCILKLDFTIALSSKYMQVLSILINLCGPNVCHGNHHNIFTCFMWCEHNIFYNCVMRNSCM